MGRSWYVTKPPEKMTREEGLNRIVAKQLADEEMWNNLVLHPETNRSGKVVKREITVPRRFSHTFMRDHP